MQERGVLRVGVRQRLGRRGLRQQRGEVVRGGVGDPLLPRPDQEDVAQVRQRVADRRHLAAVERRRRHEYGTVTELQPLPHRLRTEGGEERAEHRAVLEAAEDGGVELGPSAHQREDALAGSDTERGEDRSEARGEVGELGVGELDVDHRFLRRTGAEEPQSDVVAALSPRMAVDRLVRDVEPAVRHPVELGACGVPREGRIGGVVVAEHGDAVTAQLLGEGGKGHAPPCSPGPTTRRDADVTLHGAQHRVGRRAGPEVPRGGALAATRDHVQAGSQVPRDGAHRRRSEQYGQ